MARNKIDTAQQKRGAKLAQIVRKAREKKGYTQEELAIKAGVRIDTLRSIECGRVVAPNIFLIADLATALKGSLDEWLR